MTGLPSFPTDPSVLDSLKLAMEQKPALSDAVSGCSLVLVISSVKEVTDLGRPREGERNMILSHLKVARRERERERERESPEL